MSCPTDYSPLRCRARKIVVELRCCHVGAVFCCTAARLLLAPLGDIPSDAKRVRFLG